MGFLKSLGTVICSFLLFLALTVFSFAFLVNGTVLNADFVNSQVDKLDFSSIAHDTIEDQIDQQLSQNAIFLRDVAFKIVAAEEPLIKEQIHAGIDDAYFYFLNDKGTFNIDISLVELKQAFKNSLWQTAVDYLNEQLAGLSDSGVDRYVENITMQIPEDVFPKVLTLLPEGLRTEVIKLYLKELGGRGVFDSVSFGLDFIVETQVKASFEQYFDSFIQDIPDSYAIDESSVGTEDMEVFRDARRIIGYFQAGYIWLIVFMIVMAGLIFLINWSNIRASLRALGTDLLIFGVLDLAGVLILRNLRFEQYIPDYRDIPVSVQSWVDGLLRDITGIILWFSIGVLAAGVILMVISFIVKPREAAD